MGQEISLGAHFAPDLSPTLFIRRLMLSELVAYFRPKRGAILAANERLVLAKPGNIHYSREPRNVSMEMRQVGLEFRQPLAVENLPGWGWLEASTWVG